MTKHGGKYFGNLNLNCHFAENISQENTTNQLKDICGTIVENPCTYCSDMVLRRQI